MENKKISVGVVGLGHRGREIIKLSGIFDCVEVAAMCDIRPHNFYKTQWLSDKYISLKEGFAMTLPGIYAEESAKRNGKVIRMVYLWDEDWTTEIK